MVSISDMHKKRRSVLNYNWGTKRAELIASLCLLLSNLWKGILLKIHAVDWLSADVINNYPSPKIFLLLHEERYLPLSLTSFSVPHLPCKPNVFLLFPLLCRPNIYSFQIFSSFSFFILFLPHEPNTFLFHIFLNPWGPLVLPSVGPSLPSVCSKNLDH